MSNGKNTFKYLKGKKNKITCTCTWLSLSTKIVKKLMIFPIQFNCDVFMIPLFNWTRKSIEDTIRYSCHLWTL